MTQMMTQPDDGLHCHGMVGGGLVMCVRSTSYDQPFSPHPLTFRIYYVCVCVCVCIGPA